jgi:glycosyltransferase involved in cell wall biosynthesis
MSRNMLPFEASEARRYGLSRARLRLLLLRFLQGRTFGTADGVIFLTQYARETITRTLNSIPGETTVIHHGVDERFYRAPREQRDIDEYSDKNPFHVLYVSTVDVYKHQWQVVEAVAGLREKGYPLQLTFIGSAYPSALERLKNAMDRRADHNGFISYLGAVPYAELADYYHGADAFVFASSCENLPNVLLEAMAAGLPIACSNRGPMPSIAGDSVVYFDPIEPTEIAASLESLISDAALRSAMARDAFERARHHSWTACADETFRFLGTVAKGGSCLRRPAESGIGGRDPYGSGVRNRKRAEA